MLTARFNVGDRVLSARGEYGVVRDRTGVIDRGGGRPYILWIYQVEVCGELRSRYQVELGSHPADRRLRNEFHRARAKRPRRSLRRMEQARAA